jgi:hypothetical protein
VFAEAERRDPDHRRAWVTLVDGNNHQIPRIEAEARNRSVADRMDITGARWSVSGAEAVLKHEPSAPTATSTPTGATTSTENGNEFTNPATPTRSSLSPHLPPEEPHLKKFVTGCARHCARVIVGSLPQRTLPAAGLRALSRTLCGKSGCGQFAAVVPLSSRCVVTHMTPTHTARKSQMSASSQIFWTSMMIKATMHRPRNADRNVIRYHNQGRLEREQ